MKKQKKVKKESKQPWKLPREAKAKKDQNLRKKFNKELQRLVSRDKKQDFNNLCKDTENGNRYGKTRNVFQKNSEFRSSSNLKLVC